MQLSAQILKRGGRKRDLAAFQDPLLQEPSRVILRKQWVDLMVPCAKELRRLLTARLQPRVVDADLFEQPASLRRIQGRDEMMPHPVALIVICSIGLIIPECDPG